MTARLARPVKSLARHLLRRPAAEAPPPPQEEAPQGLPQLISVATGHHSYTLKTVAEALGERGLRHERWSYARLFSAPRLPRAVYILTDFDRLHPWRIELAGRIHQRLTEAGLTVLNDPRRFVPRTALLRRLYREGLNCFTCWLPAEGEMPERYPVFLRTIHAHRGTESGLLYDATEAEAALERAMAEGRVLSDLTFVEFAAAPSPDSGKFRKHACYGVAGRMIRALTVTDDNWLAKSGVVGAATEADYARDLEEHRDYPHAALMRRVFALAGAEFGRVDFGLVEGRPAIYELNTNPHIRWGNPHPNADRNAANALIRDGLLAALAALPRPDPGPPVDMTDVLPRDPAHPDVYAQP